MDRRLELRVGADEIAKLRPRRGERVQDRVGDLLRVGAVARDQLVDLLLERLRGGEIRRCRILGTRGHALVRFEDLGLERAGLDQHHPNPE